MSVRDKIAKAFMDDVQNHMDSGEPWDGRKAADAALTTIKASVPELVWLRTDLSCWGEYAVPSHGIKYSLTWEYGDGPNGEDTFFTASLNGVFFYSCWGFDDEDAKAEAQAHHVAQKTDWMDR